MNRSALTLSLIASLSLPLAACDDKTAAVAKPAADTPPVAAPASAPATAPPMSKVELTNKALPVLDKAPDAAAMKAAVRKVVDAYVVMKDAYVAKDVPAMKKAAGDLATAAQNTSAEGLAADAKAAWEAQLKIISASTLAITAEGADLNAMRLSLAPLSEATYAAAKSFGVDSPVLPDGQQRGGRLLARRRGRHQKPLLR